MSRNYREIYGRIGTCGDCHYYNDAENRCRFAAERSSRPTFDFEEACENFEESIWTNRKESTL